MSNSTNTARVPMYKKISFGVGMLANQMFPAALGVFMVVLVDGFGFPVWMVGVLTFAPRLLDFIIDPIMGFITDNTKSKWGKRRHYVFVGALMLGISFLFMWQIHKGNGIMFNFFYFLFFKLCLYVGLTIFSIPFVAMGYEMSDDFHERTQIMAISQWIGQWAWVIVPWFWIIIYNKDLFVTPESGARLLSVWVAVICMFFAMVPAFFITGKSTLHDTSLKPIGLRNITGIFIDLIHEFKEAFKIKDFRRLCYSTFFTFNAFNTVAQFTFFIIVYYLFNGDRKDGSFWAAIFGSGGALVTTFIVIPVVVQMSKVMGKKKAFLVSQGISIFGYILLFFLFVPGKPWLFLIALPFFSFGIGGLFTTMMSMTADICDVDELNYGQRREGIFGAIYWWVVKLGFAFAGLLSYLILDIIGFKGDAPIQTPETIFWLRFFFSAIPIFGTLVAIYFMWNYGLTHEKITEIQNTLAKRKAPKPTGSSYYQQAQFDLIANKFQFNGAITTDFSNKSEAEIQAIFAQSLGRQVHGLCFSPYLKEQVIGDVLNEAQIRRRMEIIQPHTKWVRSFSCTEGNELIPKIAREYGLKTIAGAWIGSDKEANEREINNLIALAKAGQADIVAVGNEVLLRGELPKEELIAYIQRVKTALPNIPIGCVDTYHQFVEHPELVDICDVILANCYPFWEGYDIAQASTYLQKMYAFIKTIAKDKKVIITETGWPSEGEAINEAVPTKPNVMKYFIDLNNWSKQQGIEIFYFSSFDEAWKVRHEGDIGQSWGLWDKFEKPKYEAKS